MAVSEKPRYRMLMAEQTMEHNQERMTFMSKGNLVRTPFSEISATLELLDSLGVSSLDFENLRKQSSQVQAQMARLMKGDQYLWHLLSMAEGFKEVDFTEPDFIRLGSDREILGKVHDVLLGYAEITYPEHLINCDTDPFIPNGWSVEEHPKGGVWKWNPTKVSLYLDDNQKTGKYIGGNNLRKRLAGKSVLNANVLDYLLKNPHLIPEEWKGKCIFFWGTVYRYSDVNLCVRYLCWGGGGWYWFYCWLGINWSDDYPAAVSAQ